MTITNRAIGEKVNLATVLNTKLEAPVLQSEMGLNTQANATKQAVRWDEFSVKHNNDGTFKSGAVGTSDIADSSVNNAKIHLTAASSVAGDAVRHEEFIVKHNADGSFKAGIISAADIADGTIANAEISTTAAIAASKLAIQKMYKKSPASAPSATADTFGTAVDIVPVAGYAAMVPQYAEVVFGGTFGTETVTATITVTYSDATTATVTKTATAAGTVALTSADIMALIKDGVFINKISVAAKSSIASTTATVAVNHYGFYL